MKESEIIFLNSVFFVVGFIVVFSIVGVVLQLLTASIAVPLMSYLRIIGGAIILLFGVILIISTKYLVPFFSREYKFHARRFGNSYISSLIFGIAFAIGWTPCVGPILGSIYALALTSPGLGFLLLLAYSLGLGIPFLICGAFVSKVSGFMKKIGPFMKYFNIIGGIFLVTMGLLVITGYIGMLSIFLVSTGGTYGFLSLSGTLSFAIAILAGILTFLSPCILPLVPAYLSYMGNTVVEVKK